MMFKNAKSKEKRNRIMSYNNTNLCKVTLNSYIPTTSKTKVEKGRQMSQAQHQPLVKKSCVEKIFVFTQKDFNPTDQTFMISFLHLNKISLNDTNIFEFPNTSFGSRKCNTVPLFMMRCYKLMYLFISCWSNHTFEE